MANMLRTLLRHTRLALEEFRALSWRAVHGPYEIHTPGVVDTCQLEQRVLLSASPAAAPVDSADHSAGNDLEVSGVLAANIQLLAMPADPSAIHQADSALDDSNVVLGQDDGLTHESRLEIVFVDASAAAPEEVVANLRQGEGIDYRVFVLDAGQDGVEQISAILSEQTEVSAIHLVSHGAAGEIKLGASWLTGDNAGNYSELFAGWRAALAPDADILVYGCDLAASDDGLALLRSLHEMTGADVAGSDDPTGAASAGGDWDLEHQFGTVLSQIAFQTRQQSDWLSVLAATTFQQGVSGYNSAQDVAVSIGSRTIADPDATVVSVQGPTSDSQLLLRFDDLFGTGTGQIPWGSTINAVALNVEATNYSNAWLDLHRMATDWSDSGTWDSLADGVQLNDVEAASIADSSVSFVAAGTYTFTGAPLTNTVQGWSDGKTNLGWVVVNSAGPAVQLASSEAATSVQRPRLTIDFTAPAVPLQISVTTTQDVVDAPTLSNFGTLLASPGADGMISLREAIIAANSQAGMNFIYLPTGTIQFASGSGDNNATSGDLDITDAVLIRGANRYGTVIDGNGLDSIFEIRNGQSATIANLTITGGNSSGGGAIHVQNGGTVTVEDVRLVGNQATFGGAIYHERGTLELINSELIGNTASSSGGGLENRDVAVLRAVTVAGNTAPNGAGINQQGGGSSLSMENGTLSGNVASVRGGGLRTTTAASIVSSTIAYNEAPSGGGISATGAGTSVQLRNTILAQNTGSNSDTTLSSLGFNLDSDVSAGLSQPTDLLGLNPGLQALQLNGGDVQTHALMDGSVAINAGTSAGSPAVDARGVAHDVLPDIGAVEGSNALSHKIFWVDDSANTLSRVNVDGSAKQTLLTGLGSPRGIAVDLANGYIYWTEASTGEVNRSGLDGQNVTTLISSGLSTPQGIALDVAGHRLYITDDNTLPALDRIAVANLDGTSLATSIDGTASGGFPTDVAFDVASGYLYWVDQGDLLNTSRIYRATPGSGLADRSALVTASSNSVRFKSLALDVPNNLMFWTEDGGSGQNLLRSAHLDGTGATTISTSAADPYGVAADPSGTFVVWVDPGLGTMTVTRPNGMSEQTILIALDNPTDIAVVQFVDNVAPSLQLTNQVPSLPETTVLSSGVRVADITVYDDGVGTNVVSLSGADSTMFEVVGNELRLRADAVLDYETQTELNVTVSVDDPNVGTLPDDSVSVTLTITNVNDEIPVGVGDTYLVTEDLPIEVDAAAGVLANDTDADGDLLSAAIVSGPSHGSLSFSLSGRFTYQPAANYFGTDTFTYRASDGVHTSAITTVTLSVADVSLTPTSEFRVNTTTTNVQQTSRQDRGSTQAVAMNPLGDYVVVWSSADQDGSGWGIYGQRFNRLGTAQGGEFQVNVTPNDDQVWASVAMDQTGRFVVTWTSSNQDGTPTSVFFRVFNADGTERTGEIQANVDTGDIQEDSAVDMDASGNFIVAWEGTGPDDANGVFARRFTVNGFSPDGSEFRLNTDLSRPHHEVAVSMNDNGDFAAVWDDASGVNVRRFANTGVAIDATEINVESEVSAGQATVELANDRGFVAAWRMTVDGARNSYIRRYDSSGIAFAVAQQVHTTTANDQTNPSLAMDSAGNFIVAWEGEGTGDPAGVFYRVYNASGTPLTGETRINQTTSAAQEMVSLAMLDTDNFVLVWSGNGTGDTAGVFARQVAPSNLPPSINVGNASLSYLENAPPLAIDGSLTVTDADDLQLAGATLRRELNFWL